MLQVVFWLMIGLIGYAYLGYPVTLWLVTRLRRRHWQTSTDYRPTVSVIIAAYNEQAVIARRVQNLLEMDYPIDRIELLIGSDGSDDGTLEILEGFKEPRLKVSAWSERRGKVAVLKDLVGQAAGEALIFSDANTTFERDAISALVAHLADSRVGAVCGNLHLVSGSDGTAAETAYWKYEKRLKRMEGSLGCALGVNGGIYAIRSELFPELADNVLVDDFVIGMKVHEQDRAVVFADAAQGTEPVPETVTAEFIRRVRIGAGDYQSLWLCRKLLTPWRGLVSWCFWSHKVLRWLVPFLLPTIFIVNSLLVNRIFYAAVLVAQAAAYAAALFGWLLEHAGRKSRLFHLPHYFVGLNLALLLGFFGYVLGIQKVTWKRTKHAPVNSRHGNATDDIDKRETSDG